MLFIRPSLFQLSILFPGPTVNYALNVTAPAGAQFVTAGALSATMVMTQNALSVEEPVYVLNVGAAAIFINNVRIITCPYPKDPGIRYYN